MPPDADPVMADRVATDAATDTRGLPPPIARTASLTIPKTGRAAITAPNPTKLAVLKIGSTDASAPLSRLALRSVRPRQLLAISKRMAKNSEKMIAHRPRTLSMLVSPKRASAR